eukprot:TRINITY_DN101258_c0_g1_i1.p1 TRINITY_DN101258_c0_g1~~TRINITY_DN101258_c0_g1_i1.p1  ORF type:complete len:366 (+),score=38.34 TRINITY_DN101258_c0_g1_i1:186-1283(+)
MAWIATTPAPAFRRWRCSPSSSHESPQSIRSIPTPLSAGRNPSPTQQGIRRYERIEANIGEGTYGKVHKALDRRTNQIVAIKTAKEKGDRDAAGVGLSTLREIKLLQAIKHQNVIASTDIFTDCGAVHLVMEFMDGDLRKLIHDKSTLLKEKHVLCLASQLMSAVNVLHRQWFVHRDVTPGNVLLDYRTGIAKLCDFGTARTIGQTGRPMTPLCTTLWYRAPELLFGARFYGCAVDLWSCGCVIGELFTREALFRGQGDFDMLGVIFDKRGGPTDETWQDVSALPCHMDFSHLTETPMSEIVPSASDIAADFLDALLQLDPKRRPTAEVALGHAALGPTNRGTPLDLPFVVQDVPLDGGCIQLFR